MASMKEGGKSIMSPDATEEFTKNFIAKHHPSDSSYTLLDEKVTVDGIDELLEKIRLQISVVPT
jgi:hypothetical protein